MKHRPVEILQHLTGMDSDRAEEVYDLVRMAEATSLAEFRFHRMEGRLEQKMHEYKDKRGVIAPARIVAK